jgi:hypothetical protein
VGFGFESVNGAALMQRFTSRLSLAWSQALKKSACMVEYAPEESFGVPLVGGMGNSTFVWRRGTGYGWLVGHVAFPPLAGVTAWTMCER